MADGVTSTARSNWRPETVGDCQARALATAVARGDEAAFEALYDLYHGRLMRFALVATHGDELLAAEIVQSTFLTAAASLKPVETAAHLWNWLALVTRQHLSKTLRTRKRSEATVPMPEDWPEDSASEKILEQCLDKALLTLSPEDRQTIEWHYFENLSHKEIAQRLDLTPKAVSSRLERCRALLRSIINKAMRYEI
jgi:RNA polymerase sigma-70 factor (ECF subfamily)